MDYFGRLVDDLTDMVESIQDSGNAEDGIAVIRALERAMRAAVEVERMRTKSVKAAQQDAVSTTIEAENATTLGHAA